MNVRSTLTFFAAATILVGCGGGGGDDAVSAPGPVATNAAGIWSGIAQSAGTTREFAGVITSQGEGRFVDVNGTQYVVDALSGNDGSVDLSFTAIAPPGFAFLDGSTVTTGSIDGTVVEGTSFKGDYSLTTGESGTISMTYDAVYERDSSLDKLAGSWSEEFGTLTFDPDGSFFEQDSFGCVFDGQASIIDEEYNVYDLAMTVSLCGEGFDGEYTGLGVLIDATATEDRFILQMNSEELILTTSLARL